MTATKVFLSYAHADADKAFVSELYDRIKRDGIECFFDEESIAPGANFVLKISEAIDECNYLVVVMSPAYFSARFTQAEWSPILAGDPANESPRLMPLLLQQCNIPALLKPLKYIDVSSSDKFNQNYPAIRRHLGWLAPNDIEQRSKEIDELAFKQLKSKEALKLTLDFAIDFAPHKRLVNHLAGIVNEFFHTEKSTDMETRLARVDLLESALNVRDDIINQLASGVAE